MAEDGAESPPTEPDDETVTDPTRETSIEEAARPDADGDGDGPANRDPEPDSPAPDDGASDPDDADPDEGAAPTDTDDADSPDGAGEADSSDTTGEADAAEEATGYAFSAIGDEHWPPNVEYTPKYDDRWVYTVGGRAGGSRDDVPMQGLELQVAAPRDAVEAVVRACMEGLYEYEAAVGEVPRHMFVSDAAAFEAVATDGAGTVAVFQPRADDGTDLLEHMTAFREGTTDPTDLTPNRERARRLAAHLQAALAAAGVGADAVATHRAAGGPPRPVADGRVYERYAALGAEGLYDPTDGPADVDSPGADGVDPLEFEPAYLDVADPDDLWDEPDDTADTATDSTPTPDGDESADPRPTDTPDDGDDATSEATDDDDGQAATETTPDGAGAGEDTADESEDDDGQAATETTPDGAGAGEDTADDADDDAATGGLGWSGDGEA